MCFCCSAVTDWQEPPGHYAVDWNPGRSVLWPQYEMTSTANWPWAQGLSLLFWPSALCRTGPTIKLYKQTRSACLLHWVSRAGPWAKLEFQGAFLTDFFSHPSLLGWPTRDQVITERPNVPQQDLIRYSSPCQRYMIQYDNCWFIHLWQGLDIWSDQILLRYWSDTQVIGMWINNADMIMSVIIFLICFYRRKCCCCLRARNSGSILNQRRICRRFGEPLHLLIFFYNSTDID